MRDTTERPEGVEAGTAKLVRTDSKTIVSETEKLLYDKIEYNKMAKAINPYGDGNSAKTIYKLIENKFHTRYI